jgi:aspartate/methionine/tyrosine aminotransferase
MHIAPFAIEEFFARYEFTTPHHLCASDCETVTVAELLALAGTPLSDLARLRLGYTESQGHPELRAAVAGSYGQVTPEQVVMLAAPEEGIYLGMRTLLEPGDEVVVMAPAYESLLHVAEHICGAENVKKWWIQPVAGGWQLDVNELEGLVTPITRLLVVNFPHNPTGYLPSQSEFTAVLDIARRHNTWLFFDEMYRGLELGGRQALPSAADRYERSLVLAGLSKVHGLPGLRCGWLVIHDEAVRGRFINWKHYTTICAPGPSELLALAGLRAEGELIRRNRQLIEANLESAEGFFARWPELFTWRRPLAGSVALAGIGVPSATAYCHDLAARAGVLLLPSSCLGYGDGHVRFGFGRRDFGDNLAHYEAFLRQENANGAIEANTTNGSS